MVSTSQNINRNLMSGGGPQSADYGLVTGSETEQNRQHESDVEMHAGAKY